MAETYDYAKLGQTTYKAHFLYDDGDSPVASSPHEAVKEFTGPHAKRLAKAWITARLRRYVPPKEGSQEGVRPRYYGTVERGTYTDASFQDDDLGYGWVSDASWEPDETWRAIAYAYDGPTGEIEWEEDTE